MFTNYQKLFPSPDWARQRPVFVDNFSVFYIDSLQWSAWAPACQKTLFFIIIHSMRYHVLCQVHVKGFLYDNLIFQFLCWRLGGIKLVGFLIKKRILRLDRPRIRVVETCCNASTDMCRTWSHTFWRFDVHAVVNRRAREVIEGIYYIFWPLISKLVL